MTIEEPCPFAHSLWLGNSTRTNIEVVLPERQEIGRATIDQQRPYVRCRVCGCQGPVGDTVEEAIERWNYRPVPIVP